MVRSEPSGDSLFANNVDMSTFNGHRHEEYTHTALERLLAQTTAADDFVSDVKEDLDNSLMVHHRNKPIIISR